MMYTHSQYKTIKTKFIKKYNSVQTFYLQEQNMK